MKGTKKKENQFMELYTPVHENFERFCKARVYGDIDYKDLMHDTIVIAYEKFHKLEDSKAFLHFLFGICIRVLANTNKKQRLVHLKDESVSLQVEDHSTRADRNDDTHTLYTALAKLPESQREALVLFEISGFSIAEIAELQKAGISAVKQRLARGRQALLTILSADVKKRKGGEHMTHQDLDNLFASARTSSTQTSVEEVTAWVGTAAAASTGVVGIAAKLKLLIAKKSLIMLGSVLGTVGIVTVTATLMGSSPETPKENVVALYQEQVEATPEPQEEETTIVFQQNEDSIAPEAFPEPVVPTVPVAPEAFPEPVVPLPEEPVFETFPEPTPPTPPVVRRGVSPVQPTVGINKNNCKKKRVSGNGNVTTKEYNVGSFSNIEIDGVFDVFLIQGNQEGVRVETDENLQEYIEIENTGNKLLLSNSCQVHIKKSTKLNVYVTIQDLSHLYVGGVGDVIAENQLKGDNLHVNIAGVGDLNMDIDYSSLVVDYSGVGDIHLSGEVDKAMLDCSGVGDVFAYKLMAKRVELDQSGVGDTDIYANESLDVDFTGVGSVHYKGQPSEKNINKSGIGSVKAR